MAGLTTTADPLHHPLFELVIFNYILYTEVMIGEIFNRYLS